MPSTDRRALLAGVAGLVGVAGCLNGETPTATTATDPETGHLETDPPAAGRLTLDPVPPTEADEPLTVLPDDLRRWIRQAADGTTVRGHAGSYVYPIQQSYEPIPPLTAFDRVRIDDPDSGDSGSYDVDADGGVYYERAVGAEAVSPPADAEVTPVSELPNERRELALAAIGAENGGAPRVEPQTALGSWVRTEFFGGYYSHEGTTYRGHEVQQTDVAFFATEVWYVLSLSPTETEAATTLTPAAPEERARMIIDDLRSEHETVERMERDVEGLNAGAAETLAAAHPYLLTHDAVYQVTFVY
ncbi:hypothetical protein [Halolamina salifodinae]|uniref:Uncharacterized protein n=1 Tax=Halolamina salifodinae TaxID=1202767 RepID=A0A8T4GWX6_9EURY|nr:hypothetical protein [Halolamina salifodinae]MBP1986960.1 hypothetical protein [Halolamina salifodinae]